MELASLAGEEKRIVAFLLPKMEACFDDPKNRVVVVDSQDFPWLPHLTLQQMVGGVKPSGFITHSSLYEPRDPKAVQVVNGVRAKRNGIPAAYRILARDVYVIEGRRGLTLDGQLKLVNSMCLLAQEFSLKGVVIGQNGFWLIKACRTVIQQRIKAKWTDPGTKKLFATFFEPSTLCATVNVVCNGLGCEIVIKAGRPSFLGSGNYGHAFRVWQNGESTEKVLKSVDWTTRSDLVRI